jgi:uncharacterized membrane protein YkvA (DUF1232 family)
MKLIDEARQAYKLLSVWAFIVIGAMPDVYAGIQGLGWLDDKAVPPVFVWTIRIGAAVGVALRLVKQQAKAQG